MKRGAALLTGALMLGWALPVGAAATKQSFANYDGDTFRATFRIENIDTPEIKGACAAEKALAERARAYTEAWLAKGHVVIRQTGVDRYKRVLARVSRETTGEDLGEALIAAGLARPWKGRREKWC